MMQTAHAPSQPASGQKQTSGLGNNIWTDGDPRWPTPNVASSGWANSLHMQGGAQNNDMTSNELGWSGGPSPSVSNASPWGAPSARPPGSMDVVVDAHDKETWPSIGDKTSETGSMIGDDVETASGKSGSVISSSSNPGATAGSGGLADSLSVGQQSGSSSIGWGSLDGGDKLGGSGNSWGIGPDTGNSMWGSSANGGANSSALSSAWGAPGVDANRGAGGGGGGSGSAWQGMNITGSGMNLQQQNVATSSAADTSGWGTNSTSVIASSISSSLESKGAAAAASAMGNSLWNSSGGGANPAAPGSGWGSAEPPPKPDSQGTGWGSPSPTPALMNTGTEAWGQPQPTAKPPNASSAGWGQAPPASSAPGWGQPSEKPAAPPQHASGWGDPSKPPAGGATGMGWGQAAEQKPASSSAPGAAAWGAPPVKPPEPNASAAGWGAKPPTSQAPTSQWGAAPLSAGGSTASSWGAPMTSTGQAQPAWGGPAPTTTTDSQQQPRPIGAAQPPAAGAAQPSTWAHAASKGLAPRPLDRSCSKEDLIRTAVNCNEGWGKTPVRQDTSWDMEESPKLPRKPLSSTGSNSSQENASAAWNQPNDGTAIWESAKIDQPPPQAPQAAGGPWGNSVPNSAPSRPPPQVGPATSTHWGNPDADHGTWEGPPDAPKPPPSTNMWNGPPKPQQPPNQMSAPPPNAAQSNQWGGATNNSWGGDDKSGHWGSGSSGSDWGSSKSDNGMTSGPPTGAWGAKKDDNMWDRNGSSWGGAGGPPSRANSTEIGTWGADGAARQNSGGGSWGDEGQSNWGGGRGGPGSDNVDNGTSYWGDPGPGKGQWANKPPMPGDRPPWTQPPKGWGDAPKDSVPVWGQEQKPNWNDQQSGWGAMKQRQPGGWGETNDWGGKGPVNDMSRPPPQPQMRARMLQHLVQMGFKKDDAQRTLIKNNMHFDNTVRELAAQAAAMGVPDADAVQKGRALRSTMHASNEDLADPHDVHNQLLPPQLAANPAVALASAQLAAHSGAAAAAAAAALGAGNPLKPALHNPSSLAAPSINPLLQRHLSQQVGKAPQIAPGIRTQQQQQYHNLLAQQLQQAVNTGLVSPSLLNQPQLAPNMLINLQQLLQLSTLLNRLHLQHDMVQQNRQMPPNHQRAQLDQCQMMIRKIKQQILHMQQQIQQAQVLGQTPTSVPPPPPNVAPPKSSADVANELSGLSLATSQGGDASGSQAPQSRLNQWIKDNAQQEKIGFKHSLSTPNLPAKDDPTGIGGFADSTWAPSVSGVSAGTWPASSMPGDVKMSVAGAGDSAAAAVSSAAAVTSAEAAAALDIVEFVPGKPWQGLPLNSVEDDPFITPSSVSRSYSYNANQMGVLASAGNTAGANTSPTSSSEWGGARPQWSTAADDWNQKAAGARAGGPPMTSRSAAYNRSVSMPAGQKAVNSPSNWIMIKNLSPKLDQMTMEALCKQHGPLQSFVPNMANGQVLVAYKLTDSAMRAQQALNNLNFFGTNIQVDFINEMEAKLITRLMGGLEGATWSGAPAQTPQAPMQLGGGGQWGAGGAGGALWSDDQSLLPGGLGL